MTQALVKPLSIYLDLVSRKPFVWGELDCAMFAANWAFRITGVDPVSEYRGRYKTELGCARILKREGGLLALTARAALASGFYTTDEPSTGAIGVCALLTARGEAEATAIRLGDAWAFLSTSGVTVAPARHLAVWGF